MHTPPLVIRGFSALHRLGYKLSGGRLGNKFRGAPAVLLTTTGRKTGKERTWPLLALRKGDAYVLAASNSGHDRHPSWYLNLQANPEVMIKDGQRTVKGRARTVTGPERDQLYAQFVDVLETYDDYAKATTREIPVVLVEPVA